MPEKSGEGRNGKWLKQDFIIETEDKFPRQVCISLWNDKAKMLENFKEGEKLKAAINIESREFREKWYTDVKAWRLEKPGGNDSVHEDLPGDNMSALSADDIPPPKEDDLPF